MIDLTLEHYTLPLTLRIDGEKTELTLTDIPLAAFQKFQGTIAGNGTEALTEFALTILNSNEQGVEFSETDIDTWGIAKLTKLCRDYSAWLKETLEIKN